MMRRSEWLVRTVLVFLALYGLLAVGTRNHEKFPFFAWDLFSSVPTAHSADYSARLIAADGYSRRLPVYFEQSGVTAGAQEIQGYTALQAFGKAIRSGDKTRTATLRRSFEATYFPGLTRVRYEIVRRTFDIRVRVTCLSCYTQETVVASYTTR